MKNTVVLTLALSAQAMGNILLSKEMKSLVASDLVGNIYWFSLFLQAAGSPTIWIATAFLTLFFLLFTATLSWADLSFVLPATSFGYRRWLVEVPFASITWSRFNGSPALPRRTLSLRPATAGPVGSPLDECKIGATTQQVKQWCSSRFSLGNRQASSMSKAASRGGCDTPQ